MPKSSTERSRIYRKKLLKEDKEKYDFYKNKDKERKRAERSKPKVSSQQETDRRKKANRDRVRKFRILQKAKAKASGPPKKDIQDHEEAYNTPQALGKAVGKVKPHLPKSPRKRKAVVVKLASAVGMPPVSKKRKSSGNKGLPAETVTKVRAFYKLDSISRQAPGRKEFVVCRDKGKKQHLQKRHLLYSLREVHALFLKENPSIKIGLSKFSSLRPANVLLSSQLPRNVCLCQYHENIKLICYCLAKEIHEFPSYSGDFVDNFVCSPDSEECMLGKCSRCPNWLDSLTYEDSSPVSWYEWKRIDVSVVPTEGKKNGSATKIVKKMKKLCKEGTISDVLASLEVKLPFFLEHVFIKRQQSQYFEGKLNDLREDEAVVQVDFAENYSCRYQDEIQSAHWCQDQVVSWAT